ncbi:MAG TPA: VOC family protein [Micromonosporaceae bacterium]|nr:VOC family protein [Micromonosporaceae bacterium]
MPERIDEQSVVPMISYEDGPAAMDWLAKAFGFTERTRWLGDDGSLSHGEMLAGGGLIMLATAPTAAYEAPRNHRDRCRQAEQWSRTPYVLDGVLVYVSDVDAHFEQARAAGATILSAPEDSVGRLYRAEDVEGHRWMFMQRP